MRDGYARLGCVVAVGAGGLAGYLASPDLVQTPAVAEKAPSSSARPKLVLQVGHSGDILAVAVSPDGRTVATGAADRTVVLWDAGTGAVKRVLSTSGIDGPHSYWSDDKGPIVLGTSGGGSVATSLSFSPEGRTLAGSIGSTIALWEAETGTLKRKLMGDRGWGRSVAFSRDGRRLASGWTDATVRLWDPRTGRLLRTLEGDQEGTFVAFSPDGKQLAGGSGDGQMKIWDIATGRVRRTLRGHSERVFSVAFSRDGRRLASGGPDAILKLWDVRTGRLKRNLRRHTSWVMSVTFSPDGK
jgi:WD40 repeat protein